MKEIKRAVERNKLPVMDTTRPVWTIETWSKIDILIMIWTLVRASLFFSRLDIGHLGMVYPHVPK